MKSISSKPVVGSAQSLMFVCLGNICRSPLAEGIFRSLVEQKSLEAEFTLASCGTGPWHVGQPAHHESRRVAAKYGIDIEDHVAQQLDDGDFLVVDLFVAMDRSNRRDILAAAGARSVNVVCLREFDPDADSLDVPDPYYGGRDGFEEVYAIIQRSCSVLLDEVLRRKSK